MSEGTTSRINPAIAAGYGKVALIENGSISGIVIQELFDKDWGIEEFDIDFAPVANSVDAVVSAEFLSAKML